MIVTNFSTRLRMALAATVVLFIAVVGSTLAPAVATAQTPPPNTITVETVQGDTVTQKVLQKARSSWPWYIVRGSGIVAAVSLVLLMLSGIGQITGNTYRFLEPLTAWASHRALGIVFGVTVLLHVGGLLFDHFTPFTIWEVLVPWLSDYKPVTLFGVHVGSLYVALGVLAFYLTGIVVVTSLTIINKRPSLWKLVHLASYVIIMMVFVHALYIGTDVSHGWMRVVWFACAAAILGGAVFRLWRARTT